MDPASRLVVLAAAVGTGCLPTLMLFFNSQLAQHGGPLFASWTAHGTGSVAAVLVLLFLRSRPMSGQAVSAAGRPPLWAYLGGCTGAVNVMVSSSAVNMGLALAGTQAVALSGQMLFSFAADRWGAFGLARRRLHWRDLVPMVLIVSGSLIIIAFGTGPR